MMILYVFVARSHMEKRRSILAILRSISMRAIVATSAFLHRNFFLKSALTNADSARNRTGVTVIDQFQFSNHP